MFWGSEESRRVSAIFGDPATTTGKVLEIRLLPPVELPRVGDTVAFVAHVSKARRGRLLSDLARLVEPVPVAAADA